MIGIGTDTEINYVGNGTQSNFAIPFPVYEYDSIKVYVRDSGGIKTLLVAETDFEIKNLDLLDYDHALDLIDAAQSFIDGGNLKTGYTLYIEIGLDVFQPATLRNLGAFAPTAIEKALDRFALFIKRTVAYLEEQIADIATFQSQIDAIKKYGYDAQVVSAAATVAGEAGKLYVIKTNDLVTIELPAAPSANQAVHVKRRGSTGTINISGNGNNVDGSATFALSSLESSASIIYDGTEWLVV